jgi:acyl-coenzyme A thioesterase PaaI-like protein
MKPLRRFQFMLWSFGKTEVPLIGHVKPKLLAIDDERIIIKLPFCRRNKNHLHSMYFGALTIGADLAGGFHGLYHAKQSGLNVSLAFKSFEAQFLRRPESDVYFVSEMGHQVKNMLAEAKKTNTRINQPIDVTAYINYPKEPTKVATFQLELSLKINKK